MDMERIFQPRQDQPLSFYHARLFLFACFLMFFLNFYFERIVRAKRMQLVTKSNSEGMFVKQRWKVRDRLIIYIEWTIVIRVVQ